MLTATLTRQVRPIVPLGLYINSARAQHFLANVPLKRRGADKVSVDDLKGKKFYEELDDVERKNVDVVWVSRDKEPADQLEYYEKAMPAWCYVPFGDPNIAGLLEKYGVKVIPALKMVNDKGKVLSETVRADVESCVKGDAMKCYKKWKEMY
ncbi:hypothetical protein NECAME_12985 [Necator americanus]|uniref:protein-disulfide reductase n=1 Tax=Necator americanus TaxID=51031 RepID=W2SZL6_NECAM|nr:hypothetical protein NECAME_12985 [Necator americanus]ETN74436.1 hypothetical protein NECAME_12985 [Necator americanus]